MKRPIPALRFLGAVGLFVAAACAAPADDAANDSAAAAGQTAAPPASQSAGGFLDPNAATREQLMTLPAMDSATASALVAGRPYENMLGVDAVLAAKLTEAQRDSIYTRFWTPLDLNTATGEEIMLIPRVGDKMRHEFEEYRPYTDIARFRREIGKYVDEAEVARLERYVTIR